MKARTAIVISLLSISPVMFTSAYVPLLHKAARDSAPPGTVKRYLYVAVPGIRDYLGYGGHGILVFDIDNHHHFVKRITTGGLYPDKKPSNVKEIAVSISLNSIYITTI